MFLSGTSTIVIRRIGRWSSEAFLEYIREQVEDFTAGVAQKMLKFEKFNNMREGHRLIDTTASKQDNDDGLETVPFTMRYSNLALESDYGKRPRRGHR